MGFRMDKGGLQSPDHVSGVICHSLRVHHPPHMDSVSIKLLRPYFNQHFYIMLYVYGIVCCFRAHNIS